MRACCEEYPATIRDDLDPSILENQLTERCEKDAREIRQATVWNGAQQRGEAYKPNTDVFEAFQDLGWLDMGILCTTGSISCSSYFGV